MVNDLEMIEKAEQFIRENKLKEAEEMLLPLLSSHMAHEGRVYFDLGNIDFLNGDTDCCREWYDKAILNGYVDYNLLMNYAKLEKVEGNVDACIKFLKQARDINKDNTLTYLVLAGTYLETCDYDSALKTADGLIREKPSKYDGYHLKATIMLEDGNEIDQCLEMLKSVKPLFSLDHYYVYDLANALYNSKDYLQALDTIDAFLASNEGDEIQDILAMKTRVLIALGDYDKVEPVIRELAFTCNNDKAKAALAFLLIWQNNETEALSVLDMLNSAESNPFNRLSAKTISRFIDYKHSGFNAINMEDVIQEIIDVMLKDEEGYKYLPMLSAAYFMGGKPDKAEDLYKDLLDELQINEDAI